MTMCCEINKNGFLAVLPQNAQIELKMFEYELNFRDSNLYRRPADGEDDDDDQDEPRHPPLVPQRLPGDLVAHRVPEPLEHAQVEDHDEDERNGVAGDEEYDLQQY